MDFLLATQHFHHNAGHCHTSEIFLIQNYNEINKMKYVNVFWRVCLSFNVIEISLFTQLPVQD